MTRRRFSPTPALATGGAAPARERQWTIFERMETLAQRVEGHDPATPALGLFCVTLALIALGLLVQVSHAATIATPTAGGGFWSELLSQTRFRMGGLVLLLVAARLGPAGLRSFVPALTVIALLMLIAVYVPGLGEQRNGSHRWLGVLGHTFQPSEFARIVIVLWLADRCVRLGPLVRDLRRGIAPMLALVLGCFALIAAETDLGGAILFLICALATMWVGGARFSHVVGSLCAFGLGGLSLCMALVPYIRQRMENFLGYSSNAQMESSLAAIGTGDLAGIGLGLGDARNAGVPYLDSDLVFAQVGEELGLFGLLLLAGLYLALAWYALRLVLSIPDRYQALAAFGLMLSVALQAMLHMQVVSGLAPPKGMTLPLVSDGGTSLLVSCLAVGLALGTVPRRRANSA
jgi:cell division protein FtsW